MRRSTCNWAYASSCSTSQPTACNGAETDCDPSTPGNQDCLDDTGSSTFPSCYADWGSAGDIYDMSGNAKEWTNTSAGSGVYDLRGGSYTSVEAGRTCSFDFTVGAASFHHPDTGFRCCRY